MCAVHALTKTNKLGNEVTHMSVHEHLQILIARFPKSLVLSSALSLAAPDAPPQLLWFDGSASVYQRGVCISGWASSSQSTGTISISCVCVSSIHSCDHSSIGHVIPVLPWYHGQSVGGVNVVSWPLCKTISNSSEKLKQPSIVSILPLCLFLE